MTRHTTHHTPNIMQPTAADESLARDTGRNDARQALKGLFRGFDPDDWDLSSDAAIRDAAAFVADRAVTSRRVSPQLRDTYEEGFTNILRSKA